jgi:hypothetical protein
MMARKSEEGRSRTRQSLPRTDNVERFERYEIEVESRETYGGRLEEVPGPKSWIDMSSFLENRKERRPRHQ